jgi:phosphohistidine phosphatase
MKLFVLRHAEAVSEAPNDGERQLTEKGIKQAKAVGRFLSNLEMIPELILSSPLIRARETAEIVAAQFSRAILVRLVDELRPGMRLEQALALLAQEAARPAVMLVGHEPDLSEFCAGLIGAVSESIHLRKAGLVRISLPEMKPGKGVLEFLLPVKML